MSCVLVNSGCYNRKTQMRWLEQQELISHGSGGWLLAEFSHEGERELWPLPFLIRVLILIILCPHDLI